jgi:hypothetical protein
VGQHKAKARRMVPKKVSSALDLLECHVERQRVAGKNDLLDWRCQTNLMVLRLIPIFGK